MEFGEGKRKVMAFTETGIHFLMTANILSLGWLITLDLVLLNFERGWNHLYRNPAVRSQECGLFQGWSSGLSIQPLGSRRDLAS